MKTEIISYITHEEQENTYYDKQTEAAIHKLNENQRPALIKFRNNLILKGLRPATIASVVGMISRALRHIGKPPEEFTQDDIENYLLSKQHQNHKSRAKLLIYLSIFLNQINKGDLVCNTKITKCLRLKLPEEILTPEEIKRIIQVADNFRDKALLFMLYETAARKGELLQLKIKHINFDKYGALVILPQGKTTSRRQRIIDAVPDLKKWIASHPDRDNPEAPLWINIRSHKNRTLSGAALKAKINVLSERAGIKKNTYPHLFRHSRLTEMAKQGFNEAELRIFAGWSQDSTMPKVYIHLSGADVERKILQNHGLISKEEEEKTKKILRTIICWRCETDNGATAKYCHKCGADLDEEKRKQERITLIREAKDIDITKVQEMLELLNRLKKEGKIPEE